MGDYIDPNGPAQGGQPPKKGMSWMLIILLALAGCLGITCILGIIASIAIPSLLTARKHGQEAAAIGNLRTIVICESLFKEGDKDHNGKLDYGTLKQLGDTGLVDSILASGTKQGYIFEAQPGADNEKVFWAWARPALPGTTGGRVFYTNQAGVIYYVNVDRDSAITPPDPATGEPPPGTVPIGR